jgi:phosphoenolpyruvate carboxykinase (ATP)
VKQSGRHISNNGLDRHGLGGVATVHWNYNVAQLYEEALARREGELSADGCITTKTGIYTGRSPKDKFFVEEPGSANQIWWGPVNNKIDEKSFETVRGRMVDYLKGRDVFVQDVYAAADPANRLKVRVITELAWHSLFARNMFIVPPNSRRADFEPDFTIIHCPQWKSDPKVDGTRSEVCVIIHLGRREVLIGGSLARYIPERSRSPSSHCSTTCCRRRAFCRCTPPPTSGRTATSRSISACRAPARPPCRRIPRAR